MAQRVEAVGSGVDGLMQSSKGEVRRALWEMSSSERRRWPHARFQESNTEKAPQTATAAKLTIDSGSAHERQNSQRGNLSTTQEAARGPQRVCWGGGGGRDEHPPSNPCRNNEQLHCNCTATGFALSRVCIGAAKGRSSLARSRWPDAQIEVAVAKWDLGKEQQREKREKRREKREERWFGPRRAGW